MFVERLGLPGAAAPGRAAPTMAAAAVVCRNSLRFRFGAIVPPPGAIVAQKGLRGLNKATRSTRTDPVPFFFPSLANGWTARGATWDADGGNRGAAVAGLPRNGDPRYSEDPSGSFGLASNSPLLPSPSMRICASKRRVPRHSGHLPGFESFSSANTNPH